MDTKRWAIPIICVGVVYSGLIFLYIVARGKGRARPAWVFVCELIIVGGTVLSVVDLCLQNR